MIPDQKYYFFRDEVAGLFAMWAIRQSPYLIPDGLTDAVQALHDTLPAEIGEMFGMTEDELREAITAFCLANPIVGAWNVPKSGHTAPIVFSSRYDGPAPDDDFIDLHALAGNICRTLLADQEDYSPASCDTHPKGGDEGNTSAPFMSGAVPPEEAGDAQNPTGSTS